MTKKIIIMIGPAGCGKGTQNKLIEKDFGYKPLSMGDLLREELAKKTKLGKEIKKIINKGNMVPLEVASDIMFNKLKKIKHKKILVDGFPREYDQAAVFDYFLYTNNFSLVTVVHLKITKAESKKRLMLRKRTDDTIDAIKKRLDDYEKITKKVVNRYKFKNKLIEINGQQPIEKVYLDIKRKLEEQKA